MSLQRMFTRMAVGMIVGKGMRSFSKAGGFRGIQQKLKSQGGLDGMLQGGSATLSTLGMARAGGLAPPEAPKPGGGLLAQTRQEELEEQAAGLCIRAMFQAARADGHIDEAEEAALNEILGDFEPEDQHFVDQALEEPVDGAALAREVPSGAERQVYSAALLAIDPDNRAEAEFLHALAQGLSLSEAETNAIHAEMKKTLLY